MFVFIFSLSFPPLLKCSQFFLSRLHSNTYALKQWHLNTYGIKPEICPRCSAIHEKMPSNLGSLENWPRPAENALGLTPSGHFKLASVNFLRRTSVLRAFFHELPRNSGDFWYKIRRGPENDPKKSPIFSENGQSGDHFQELETHFQQVGDHFQANRDHFLKMVSVFLIRSNYWLLVRSFSEGSYSVL